MIPRTRLGYAFVLRKPLHMIALIALTCTSFAWLTAVCLQAEVSPPRARKPNATPSVNRPDLSAASAPEEATPMMNEMIHRPMSVGRFQFHIPPNTRIRDLLPKPPVNGSALTVVNDLRRVPEVELQRMPPLGLSVRKAEKQTALMIAKIKLLNQKKPGGFILALRDVRPDLAGLPFIMGDACRTKGGLSQQFTAAVALVRGALGQEEMQQKKIRVARMGRVTLPGMANSPAQRSAETFWKCFEKACAKQDKKLAQNDHAGRDIVTVARIRALMQILAPESSEMRVGLVQYLSDLSRTEATQALARLAIFSPEDEVRQEAIVALQLPRKGDYTDILLKGLRYPWPAVARRAGEAIVKLDREDLVPKLVELLDEPDPRTPFIQPRHGNKTMAMRELVRVNHLRGCLLCHEPVGPAALPANVLTAEVPVPGEQPPSVTVGYSFSTPDRLVRVDVTYLRPDFSVLQPAAHANRSPKMQRFDFMVRTRSLTAKQANAYRKRLAASKSRQPSPYRSVALAALRELTGRDAGSTADAWRRMLGQ